IGWGLGGRLDNRVGCQALKQFLAPIPMPVTFTKLKRLIHEETKRRGLYMKMNKAVPFALSAMLIGGAAVPAAVFAKDEVKLEEMQEQPSFIKVEGNITAVEKNGDITRYTIGQGESAPVVAVTSDTLVFDNTG